MGLCPGSSVLGLISKLAGQFLLGLTPFALALIIQAGDSDIEVKYLAAKPADPVTTLVARINAGEAKLAYEPNQGYLRSVLHQLDISSTSQLLVFSKTSVQSAYISPNSPRAIYFNDRAYIGWIRGAPFIELAGIDPQYGPIFYTLSNDPTQKPRFIRQTDECLQCHHSGSTNHVPGLFARSVYAGPDGNPRLAGGSFATLPSSPMRERWGGWYVTGKHGDQRHMGNEVARGDEQYPVIDTEKGANITDLKSYFDVDSYLTPHSDIVALMIAEQQMAIQNLIIKAGYVTRKAIDDGKDLRKFGFSEEHVAAGIVDLVKGVCEPLVLALTGADEPAFTSPIKGTSGFSASYSTATPSDKNGRHLGELDLKTRLLKFPCSPMIYSASFRYLPLEARTYVFRRLSEVLSGKDQSEPYKRLDPASRGIALNLLRETLPLAGLDP